MEPPAAQPPASRAIVGRVTDAGGQPVEGAVVAIAQSDRPHRDLAALTGPDGAFRLSGLSPGHYVVEARQGGTAACAAATLSAGAGDGDAAVEIFLG